MDFLSYILNPPNHLPLSTILFVSFVLGLLHGATPDEHTWPITFSYAVGKYSTKGGMKAGFLFSLGFTIQRAFLTTLGFLGLAYFYNIYNLDGIIYTIVGFVMFIAGSYILKGKYIHLHLDLLFGGKKHHSDIVGNTYFHENEERDVPLKMTIIHGLIAGFGFGTYASILTFVLAPQVGSIYFAPLPGLLFGIGTMVMQIIFGAFFGNLMRLKKLSEEEITKIAKRVAGKTLYYGGLIFMIAGILIIFLPFIDQLSISTGNPIPNLDQINIGTVLVLSVVGIVGIGSMIYEINKSGQKHTN